jgi:uncharacterized protein YcfL
MKKIILFFFSAVLATSCSVTSSTRIKANDSFVLGNNEHGSFSVKLKNTSPEEVTIHEAPITGGTHTYEVVKPSKTVKVKVDKNTALVIQNKSQQEVTVDLLIKGDTGLSMGYKN